MDNGKLDKVIKGLYACTTIGENGVTDGECNICPYNKGYKTGECWVQMNRDALELLEGQAKIINRLQKDVADLRDALSMAD